MKIIDWFSDRLSKFSFIGLLLGSILFAISLTPSLIPRSALFQGVLAGVSFALGYGVGNLARWTWLYLELPNLSRTALIMFKRVATALATLLIVFNLWKSTGWQNGIRELVELDPLTSGSVVKVALIGIVTGFVLILISSAIGSLMASMNKVLGRFIPRRIANVVGTILVAILLINLANGTIVKGTLRSIDSSFQTLDLLIDDGVEPPVLDIVAGGKGSLIDWGKLGRQGRRFISNGPSQAAISDFSGTQAKQPIRVYVGLNSAPSDEQRAQLALDELIRVGAFERKLLVIATPTGTGWVDAAATDTVEYLHHGDTAIVSMQYSYLESYLSLLTQPGFARDSARALFNAVYGHWTQLPKETRPELYLYGLSLGSHGSEQSGDLLTIFTDPIQGALWAGPPFANALWRNVVEGRNKGTPAWLPTFRDGSIVRFMNGKKVAEIPGEKWGPLRIVYLQHASDPIVFFDIEAMFKEPAWMKGAHGPDVSPALKWFPIVTFVQLLLDMPAASTVPPLGYGHNYSASGYINGWLEVTSPQGWGEADIERLKAELSDLKKGA